MFVKSTAMVSAGLLTGSSLSSEAARAEEATSGGGREGAKRFRKAVKYGMVAGDGSILEKFKLLKELGFDGVELDSPNKLDRAEVLRARDQSGLSIPGVVDSVHWKLQLSNSDPKVRAQGVEALKTALRDARAYGATTVLLVPAVVDKQTYYDDAYKRSQEEIRKVLPVAQETGVKIAIENVWNSFLLSPLEAARYVDEFASPSVGWYFDVGNVVRAGWPEHWIRVLGKRILKLDIKEYSRKKRDELGLWKGFDVELLEGDCDWPTVMKTLREIGYSGWGTAEIPGGGRERLKDIAERMDRIFAS
ncbi:MAG: sugar phosphate isomerase/epimerase [Planctomycetes bacterium]|nr:sugar phosphate isomerase/epimerase [Planctomycetota bacterium]